MEFIVCFDFVYSDLIENVICCVVWVIGWGKVVGGEVCGCVD